MELNLEPKSPECHTTLRWNHSRHVTKDPGSQWDVHMCAHAHKPWLMPSVTPAIKLISISSIVAAPFTVVKDKIVPSVPKICFMINISSSFLVFRTILRNEEGIPAGCPPSWVSWLTSSGHRDTGYPAFNLALPLRQGSNTQVWHLGAFPERTQVGALGKPLPQTGHRENCEPWAWCPASIRGTPHALGSPQSSSSQGVTGGWLARCSGLGGNRWTPSLSLWCSATRVPGATAPPPPAHLQPGATENGKLPLIQCPSVPTPPEVCKYLILPNQSVTDKEAGGRDELTGCGHVAGELRSTCEHLHI
ncbi:uncharacterized protein LOC118911688 [Manis pentadactyla]|uniref:uncharacterized protein LOC118911688 n=1 Tax=Manis pentadactyla TaxID=143292 RepID=UPI00255D0928|nr:uncharacterized protein LOC118911688 [Manis pentadactyla]XP_036739891.2 uncharacterized protein LOC118911688 [Manis pentadactyla]XP_036739892.2 uncharacterized protein LOC118911688 [Manis pentadactyla]